MVVDLLVLHIIEVCGHVERGLYDWVIGSDLLK